MLTAGFFEGRWRGREKKTILQVFCNLIRIIFNLHKFRDTCTEGDYYFQLGNDTEVGKR